MAYQFGSTWASSDFRLQEIWNSPSASWVSSVLSGGRPSRRACRMPAVNRAVRNSLSKSRATWTARSARCFEMLLSHFGIDTDATQRKVGKKTFRFIEQHVGG